MKAILLILLLVFMTFQLPQICREIQNQSKMSTQDASSSQISKTKQCFSYLIEKGEYQSIDDLEQSLNDAEEKIMTDLLDEEIKRLETIQSFIIQSKSTCEPVLKWAQNLTHIFVAAKLSHRWDSPPCLRTTQEKYELINSTLSFKNTCIVSKTQIKFVFEHRLYKKAKNILEVKKDGVGEYSLIFQKQEEGLWAYLFENHSKTPIWFEVMNRNTTLKGQYDKMMKKIQASAQQQPKNWISQLKPALLLFLLLALLI